MTINNYKVQGIKGILIKLETYPNDEAVTVTDSGILIPKYHVYESEGGREVAAMTNEKYSSIGSIIQISQAALANIAENNLDADLIKVGARVSVTNQTKASQSNWFIVNQHEAVADHEGYILVTPAAIQAVITV